MKRLWLLALLAGCASTMDPSGVQRMYVIDCGENHVKDVSRWTPGVNVGQPHVFGNHCYLVRHAKGWMLWDSGNPDGLAALPGGQTNPAGTITAFMRKPLAASLKEIGVAPGDIQHFAMSHSHGDHTGNAGLFAASRVYVQTAEYDTPGFEKLRGPNVVKLGGEHDVFGDGSVLIKPAPGHTAGHQVLVVRLPKSGPVMLSGDMVHLQYSWDNRVVPSFNFDVAQSGRTIDAMKEYVRGTGARLWINHDRAQHSNIPKAPAFVE
jgi:N-acyl homoserine lactone hydrolase